MANELNKELQDFLDNNEEFKGLFVGYTMKRGLGISRIDNDWFECDDYLISFKDLLQALNERNLLGADGCLVKFSQASVSGSFWKDNPDCICHRAEERYCPTHGEADS